MHNISNPSASNPYQYKLHYRNESPQWFRTYLLTFYSQYERLVDALCTGAQYGPEPKLEACYLEAQAWMQANYPRLRLYVTAYLQYDSEDARQGLSLHGVSCDAFEALFAAPTLDEFLRGDDGMMISRIMRTREALNLYGEHLRQLKSRE